MKKINIQVLVLNLVLVLASSSVMADTKMCGVGSKIFGKSKKILSQMSEIVTNGISSYGSSLMYGTSGCKHDGNLIHRIIGMSPSEIEYVYTNFDELKNELATGDGEIVAAFAQTLGCRSDMVGAFSQMARDHYAEILPAHDAEPLDVLANIKEKIQSTPYLRQGCQAIVI